MPGLAMAGLAAVSFLCLIQGKDADERRQDLSELSTDLTHSLWDLRLKVEQSVHWEDSVEPGLGAFDKRRQMVTGIQELESVVLRQLDDVNELVLGSAVSEVVPNAPVRRDLVRSSAEFIRRLLAHPAQPLSQEEQAAWRAAAADLSKDIYNLEMAAQETVHRSSIALDQKSQFTRTLALIFGLLAAGVGSMAVSSRFRDLFHQAVRDRVKLESAFEELVATKTALQQQKTEVEEALDEAKGKTHLFEHASYRFQQLFGGLPLGCLTFDQDLVVQEWNPAMTDLVGLDGFVGCYQPVEFTFRPDGVQPPIADLLRPVIEEGKKISFEWTHKTLEGVVVHVMYVSYPMKSMADGILGGIVAGFDITARKEAERALVESEERYEVAVKASSTGIFDWNIREGTQHWSPRVMEILGLPQDYVPLAHSLTGMIHPDDLPSFRRQLEDHLTGIGGPYSQECRIIRGDGETRWIHIRGEAILDARGHAVRMAGSIDDIHQRKAAEVALAESESRFRDVTEAAGEFVFEVDSEARISLITPRITEITGRTPEDLIGTPFHEYFAGSWRALIRQGLRKVEEGRAKLTEVLVQTTSLSGEAKWLRITASPFWDSKGRLLGYRGTGLDITTEITAAQQLAEAHSMLHDTLESIRDCFFSLDEDCVFEYANSAAAKHLSHDQDSLVGMSVWDVVNPVLAPKLRSRFEAALVHRIEQAFELMDPGTSHWYQYRVYTRQRGISVFYQDITERKSFESQIEAQMLEINEKNTILQVQQRNLEDANKRLATLATTDGLTGLKNHKAFQSALAELFDQAQLAGEPLSVVLLDVDHFKRFNDTFGHPAGDEVLRSVAMILKNLGRRGDVVARYGGEEFVIILPGTRRRDAEKAAERIRMGIANHAWPQSPITASLGVASWEGGPYTRAQLVDQADAALYKSKRDGRNRVTCWTPLADRDAA